MDSGQDDSNDKHSKSGEMRIGSPTRVQNRSRQFRTYRSSKKQDHGPRVKTKIPPIYQKLVSSSISSTNKQSTRQAMSPKPPATVSNKKSTAKRPHHRSIRVDENHSSDNNSTKTDENESIHPYIGHRKSFMRIDHSLLPLEMFDDEHTLVQEKQNVAPTHYIGSTAKSLLFNKQEWKWMPCKVIGYDEALDKFRIRFVDYPLEKNVRRLNVIFDSESTADHERRRESCFRRRERMKKELRYQYYVAGQNTDGLAQLPTPWKERIVTRAISVRGKVDSKVFLKQRQVVLATLLGEIEAEYTHAMKVALAQLSFLHPMTLQNVLPLRMHVPSRRMLLPRRNYINTPCKRFVCKKIMLISKSDHVSHVLGMHQVFIKIIRLGLNLQALSFIVPFGKKCQNQIVTQSVRSFSKMQQAHAHQVEIALREKWFLPIVTAMHKKTDEGLVNFFCTPEIGQSEIAIRCMTKAHLIMHHQLTQLMEKSIQNYVDSIKSYFIEDLQNGSALFRINLNITSNQDDNKVYLDPSMESIEKSLLSPLERMLEVCNSMCHIESDLFSMMKLQKKPLLNSDLGIAKSIENTRLMLKNLVATAATAPQQLLDKYSKCLSPFVVESRAFVQSLNEKIAACGSTTEEITQQVFSNIEKELGQDMAKGIDFILRREQIFQVSFDIECTKILEIHCHEIKRKFSLLAKEILSKMFHLTVQRLHFIEKRISESFKVIIKKLDSVPKNENELGDLEKFSMILPARIEVLKRFVKVLSKYFAQAEVYRIPIPQDKLELHWRLLSCPKLVEKKIVASAGVWESSREELIEAYKSEKNDFINSLVGLRSRAEIPKKFYTLDNVESNAEEVEAVKEMIDESFETLNSFHFREEVFFGKPLTPVDDLEKLKSDFDPYVKLWVMAADFTRRRCQWENQSFLDLDGEEAHRVLRQWENTAASLKFEIATNELGLSVVMRLSREISTFQSESLPLLLLLAHPYMKFRHWDCIFSLIPELKPKGDDAHLKLDHILTCPAVQSNISDLTKIVDAAKLEEKFETLLEKIHNKWLALEVSVIQDESCTPRILNLEHTIQSLEDIEISLQHLSSKYSEKFFEESCNSLWKLIDQALKSLRIIQQCQRQWTAFESLFAYRDIEVHFPTMKAKFSLIDASWKVAVEWISNHVNVARIANAEKVVSSLRKANDWLDDISKGVSQYLLKKRTVFPRMFFIRDSLLLRLYSAQKSPASLVSDAGIMTRLFPGIKSVSCDKDLIKGFTTGLGEEVNLSESVNLYSSDEVLLPEEWLLALQSEIKSSIRSQICNTFYNISDDDICSMLNLPLQIALSVVEAIWIYSIEGCEELLDVEQLRDRYDQDFRCSVDKLLTGSHRDPAFISCLLVLKMHLLKFTNYLLQTSSNIEQVTQSFNWLKHPKRYITDNSCHYVEVMDFQYNYANQVVEHPDKLYIRSPESDASYFSFFREMSFINVLALPSRESGMVHSISRYMGYSCCNIVPHSNIGYNWIRNQIYGVAGTGMWLTIEKLESIPSNLLSSVANLLSEVLHELRVKSEKLVLNSNLSMKLNLDFQFILLRSDTFSNGNSSVVGGICRPISVVSQNKAQVVESLLMCNGFKDAKKLGRQLLHFIELYRSTFTQNSASTTLSLATKVVCECRNSIKGIENETQSIVNSVCKLLGTGDIDLLYQLLKSSFKDYTSHFVNLENKVANAFQDACIECNVVPNPYLGQKCSEIKSLLEQKNTESLSIISLLGSPGTGKSTLLSIVKNLTPEFYYVKLFFGTLSQSSMFGSTEHLVQSGFFYYNIVKNTPHDCKGLILILDGPSVLATETLQCLSDDFVEAPFTVIVEACTQIDATPSSVTNHYAVYIESHSLLWTDILKAWPSSYPKGCKESHITIIRDTVRWLLQAYFTFNEVLSLKTTLHVLSAVESIINSWNDVPKEKGLWLEKVCIFSVIWYGGGASMNVEEKKRFSQFLSQLILQNGKTSLPPNTTSVFDLSIDTATGNWGSWKEKLVDEDFRSLRLQDSSCLAASSCMKWNYPSRRPMIITGPSFCGKKFSIKQGINLHLPNAVHYHFSCTPNASSQFMQSLVQKYTVRDGERIGAPNKLPLVVQVDDVHVAECPEESLEFIRQAVSETQWHCTASDQTLFLTNFFFMLSSTNAALPKRLQRHFQIFKFEEFSDALVSSFCDDLVGENQKDSLCQEISKALHLPIAATISLFKDLRKDDKASLPTFYNLAQIIDAIQQRVKVTIRKMTIDPGLLGQLWVYECQREFAQLEREELRKLLLLHLKENFGEQVVSSLKESWDTHRTIIFEPCVVGCWDSEGPLGKVMRLDDFRIKLKRSSVSSVIRETFMEEFNASKWQESKFSLELISKIMCTLTTANGRTNCFLMGSEKQVWKRCAEVASHAIGLLFIGAPLLKSEARAQEQWNNCILQALNTAEEEGYSGISVYLDEDVPESILFAIQQCAQSQAIPIAHNLQKLLERKTPVSKCKVPIRFILAIKDDDDYYSKVACFPGLKSFFRVEKIHSLSDFSVQEFALSFLEDNIENTTVIQQISHLYPKIKDAMENIMLQKSAGTLSCSLPYMNQCFLETVQDIWNKKVETLSSTKILLTTVCNFIQQAQNKVKGIEERVEAIEEKLDSYINLSLHESRERHLQQIHKVSESHAAFHEVSVAVSDAEAKKAEVEAILNKDLSDLMIRLSTAREDIRNIDAAEWQNMQSKKFRKVAVKVSVSIMNVILEKMFPDVSSSNDSDTLLTCFKSLSDIFPLDLPQCARAAIQYGFNRSDYDAAAVAKVNQTAVAVGSWLAAVSEVIKQSENTDMQAVRDGELSIRKLSSKARLASTHYQRELQFSKMLSEDFTGRQYQSYLYDLELHEARAKIASLKDMVSLLIRLRDGFDADLKERLEPVQENQLGNTILASAVLSYTGILEHKYRIDAVHHLGLILKESSIKFSSEIMLEDYVVSKSQVCEWHCHHLLQSPRARQNAVLLSQSKQRWPLLIDPMGIAKKWICGHHSSLVVVLHNSDEDLVSKVQDALLERRSIFVEGVVAELNPVFSVFLKDLNKVGVSDLFLTDEQQDSTQNHPCEVQVGNKTVSYYSNDSRFFFHCPISGTSTSFSQELMDSCNIINFKADCPEEVSALVQDRLKENNLNITHSRLELEAFTSEKNVLDLMSKTVIEDDDKCDTLIIALRHHENILERRSDKKFESSEVDSSVKDLATHCSLLYETLNEMAILHPQYTFTFQRFWQVLSCSMETMSLVKLRNQGKAVIEKVMTELMQYFSQGYSRADKSIFCAAVAKNKLSCCSSEYVIPQNFIRTLRTKDGLLLDRENLLHCTAVKGLNLNQFLKTQEHDQSMMTSSSYSDMQSSLGLLSNVTRNYLSAAGIDLETEDGDVKLLSSFIKFILCFNFRPKYLLHYVTAELSKCFGLGTEFDSGRCDIQYCLSIIGNLDLHLTIDRLATKTKHSGGIKFISLSETDDDNIANSIQLAMDRGNWIVITNWQNQFEKWTTLQQICDNITSDVAEKSFRMFFVSNFKEHDLQCFPTVLHSATKVLISEPVDTFSDAVYFAINVMEKEVKTDATKCNDPYSFMQKLLTLIYLHIQLVNSIIILYPRDNTTMHSFYNSDATLEQSVISHINYWSFKEKFDAIESLFERWNNNATTKNLKYQFDYCQHIVLQELQKDGLKQEIDAMVCKDSTAWSNVILAMKKFITGTANSIELKCHDLAAKQSKNLLSHFANLERNDLDAKLKSFANALPTLTSCDLKPKGSVVYQVESREFVAELTNIWSDITEWIEFSSKQTYLKRKSKSRLQTFVNNVSPWHTNNIRLESVPSYMKDRYEYLKQWRSSSDTILLPLRLNLLSSPTRVFQHLPERGGYYYATTKLSENDSDAMCGISLYGLEVSTTDDYFTICRDSKQLVMINVTRQPENDATVGGLIVKLPVFATERRYDSPQFLFSVNVLVNTSIATTSKEHDVMWLRAFGYGRIEYY